ncbi:MAG: ABC transporter ATP-binding protein [Lachnospiraceae bacterium]|nr:ABC transporter ATP-binding protein [Lachnospiraceae bacterium]
MIAIECKDVTKEFGAETALSNVSFQMEEGSIYALLGRNGAGKTTLMNCLCTRYLPDSGEIRILEEPVYENEKVLREICFMSDHVDAFELKSVKAILTFASNFYENWNNELMERLLKMFEIKWKALYSKLSKGQKTGLGILIGLCSNCRIVLFDEIYSGLDAVARQRFYELLLEEQEKAPRTFVLSTHLIEEMTGLFTHVLMLDYGSVILCDDMETIYSRSFKCIGRTDKADCLKNKHVLCKKEMGALTEYDIYDPITRQEYKELEEEGFRIASLPLQELFIAHTMHLEEEYGWN